MQENGKQSDKDSTDDEDYQRDQAATDSAAEITCQPFASCVQLDDIEGSIFSIAPAEGNKPKYILSDEDFEILSFPDKFPSGKGGYYHVNRERKLDLWWYINQHLLNCDGHFANLPEYLFAFQYATELRQINSNIGIQMRLQKGNMFKGEKVTAGMLRNNNKLREMIHQENAFKFMQTVRGTPAYWAKQMSEVFAMLKSLGVPSLFMTFSAAEYQWPDMLQALAGIQGKHLTLADCLCMTWQEKTELL